MKNNKKKILVVALLLFAVIGFAGYGVYSYYWTQGSFSSPKNPELTWQEENVIYLDGSFNPTAAYSSDVDANSTFLGSGNSFTLSCGSVNGTTGRVDCSGSVWVYNGGSTDIYVDLVDDSSYVTYGELGTSDDPVVEFNWTSKRLSPGERAELEASATLYLSLGVNNDSAEEVNSPVNFDGTIGVHYKLKATQINSSND